MITKRELNHFSIFILMFLFWIAFFLIIRFIVYYPNHAIIVKSDGIGYYSYLRSIMKDGNLDFSNEFAEFDSGKYHLPLPTDLTRTGYVPNPFSIGPAILWSPFFISADIITHILYFYGYDLPPDGYSPIYIYFCAIGTLFYGYLGFILLYLNLRIFFDKFIIVLSVLFMLFGTPLLYYLTSEFFMSHIHSFFMINLLFYYLFRYHDTDKKKGWIIFGIITGFSALIRWQNIFFALLPGFIYAISLYEKGFNLKALKSFFIKIFLYSISLTVFIVPQFIIFHIIYGFWLGVPQGESFLSFNLSRLFLVLFSSHNGLFHWHPITFICFSGLILSAFYKKIHISFIIIFLVQAYIASLPYDWWAGHSFGMRRLLNCSIILAFGLAFLLNYLYKRYKTCFYGLCIFLIILCFINIMMFIAYSKSVIPHGVPFNYLESFKMVLFLLDKYFGMLLDFLF